MTPHDIQILACKGFGIDMKHMLARRGSPKVCLARHCAMYACRKILHMSYPKIGGMFGRHHTTVISACERVGEVGDAFVLAIRRGEI